MLTTAPNGVHEIVQMFGDIKDPQFEVKHIIPITLPYPLTFKGILIPRIRCHKLLADNFIAVFKDIQTVGLEAYATEYEGVYQNRSIKGFPLSPSTHSWGIAIDLNSSTNPLGKVGDMNPCVVAIFKKHGFSWGGDFLHRLDYMHFQFATGY